MKHPKIRRLILSSLVLVLILSVLPLSAMAYQTMIFDKFYDSRDARFCDDDKVIHSEWIQTFENTEHGGFSIGISESGRQVEFGGKLYDFMGFGSALDPDMPRIDAADSITIPTLPPNAPAEEVQLWLLRYTELIKAYAPAEPEEDPDKKPEEHVHVPYNNQWFYTDTNHYRVCRNCLQYYDMDWHHDRDGDGKCDQCGMTILRYPITVLDCEGGKITVSQKDGVYNDVIEVTVETDPGYTFRQVHFFKLDEQRHELTRWKDEQGVRYHFVMPFYDVEIEAEFIKE